MAVEEAEDKVLSIGRYCCPNSPRKSRCSCSQGSVSTADDRRDSGVRRVKARGRLVPLSTSRQEPVLLF